MDKYEAYYKCGRLGEMMRELNEWHTYPVTHKHKSSILGL